MRLRTNFLTSSFSLIFLKIIYTRRTNGKPENFKEIRPEFLTLLERSEQLHKCRRRQLSVIEEKVLEETIAEIEVEATSTKIPDEEIEVLEKKILDTETLQKPKPCDSDNYFDCIEEIERKTRKLAEFREAQVELETKTKINDENVLQKTKESTLVIATARPIKRLERRLSNVERFYQEQKIAEEPRKIKKSTNILHVIVYTSCLFAISQFFLLLTTLFSVNLPSGLVFLISSLVIIASLVIQVNRAPVLRSFFIMEIISFIFEDRLNKIKFKEIFLIHLFFVTDCL